MTKAHNIALLYSLFAIATTILNIGSQMVVMAIYSGPFPLLLAVFTGTGIGLITKYILDKKYIFKHTSSGTRDHINTFGQYTAMGLVTTAIFWSFEFGFNYWFDSIKAAYIGGIIGLGISYYIKYHLDKKFVFKT